MGCKKAQGFLESSGPPEIGEVVDAKKDRRGREAAIKLARGVRHVVVARGKKVLSFDMKNDPPDDDTLAAHLLGPSGNLKAPTLRRGDTLLVGFGEEAYRQFFGQ
jgi:arsenate reductase-like glutaredoxin family protein